jgi:protein-tyrosine phosphatase
MIEWMRGGVLIQVTAGSVTGQMGRTAERMAHEILSKRWVHFLATDAHNITSRPPRLKPAYTLVAEKYSPEYAHLLCVSNPLAAFQGAPLIEQKEPQGLYEDMAPKTWWQRILNR